MKVLLRNLNGLRAVIITVGVLLSLTACNHEPKVAEIPYEGTPGGVIFLVTQSDGGNSNDAALVGELLLIDGCFRMVSEGPGAVEPRHVAWPEDFDVAFDGDDVLILNDERRVMTRVGERTLLGGSVGRKESERFGECEGRFWYAGLEVRSGDAIPSAFD